MTNSSETITPSSLLPFSFAKRFSVLLEQKEETLLLFYSQKLTLENINEIQRKYGFFTTQQISVSELNHKIQRTYENASAGHLDNFQKDAQDDESLDALAMDLLEPTELLDNDDEAPIIRLINALFAQAILEKASDIHIEPYESRTRIRFRVNSTLKQVLEPNHKIAPLLVSRIKVMAKLDISEKRLPQDGRIALRLGGRAVDIRVSTIPSSNGEKVVLRLLDKQAGRLNLKDLGMPKDIYLNIESVIKKPHGILLVTGPTGSGKTTTLYAALTLLNNAQSNIMTVEDPIEYYLDGINQTQINTKVEMTFAKGLRAILRQDPDIVMLGEIRDSETAKIAVQASLTGHLVLSTLHTNTAIGTITRLRDMGVEPFLLASSLSGVLAQRLIRTLCQKCKTPHQTTKVEQEKLNLKAEQTIYQASGCDSCHWSGFDNRIGLYELLIVDEKIQELIHHQKSEMDILKETQHKIKTLKQQAINLVIEGKTTLEEAIRVVSF
jgi:general secretion pathway protein E